MIHIFPPLIYLMSISMNTKVKISVNISNYRVLFMSLLAITLFIIGCAGLISLGITIISSKSVDETTKLISKPTS